MTVKETIDQKISSKPVFMVSKSSCPYCVLAKQVLEGYNIPAENIEIMEIDGDKDCQEIQDQWILELLNFVIFLECQYTTIFAFLQAKYLVKNFATDTDSVRICCLVPPKRTKNKREITNFQLKIILK